MALGSISMEIKNFKMATVWGTEAGYSGPSLEGHDGADIWNVCHSGSHQ